MLARALKASSTIIVMLMLGVGSPAMAQSYPSRTIRVVNGFGAAGAAGIVTRIISDEMGKLFGQPMIMENRPGANGLLAAQMLKAAPPDGYTVYGGTVTGFSPVLMKDNSIIAAKEFAPISGVARGDRFLYVPTALPVHDLKELRDYAKTNKVRFATPSSTNSLLMAGVASRLGITYDQIPYKDSDQTVIALITGDAQVTINTAAANFLSQAQAGKLRPIVSFSSEVSEIYPDVKTARAQGVDMEVYTQQSLWAPLGTPPEIIDRLSNTAIEALKHPEVIREASQHGLSTGGLKP